MSDDPISEAELVWENEGGKLRRNVLTGEASVVQLPQLPSSTPADQRQETWKPPDST